VNSENCKLTSGDTLDRGKPRTFEFESREKRTCIKPKSPWTKPCSSLSSYGQTYHIKSKWALNKQKRPKCNQKPLCIGSSNTTPWCGDSKIMLKLVKWKFPKHFLQEISLIRIFAIPLQIMKFKFPKCIFFVWEIT
jgi:hypothetical protein